MRKFMNFEVKMFKIDIFIIGGGMVGCFVVIIIVEKVLNVNVLIVEKVNIKWSGCFVVGVNVFNVYIIEGEILEIYL